MMFALTHGRRRPAAGDVLRGPDHLDAVLAGLSGAATLRLWQAFDDPDDGASYTRLASVRQGPDARARIGALALAHAAPLYNTGDCWVMAHVAGLALDRPVAPFYMPGTAPPDEPDHLAVDLGAGLYLDARGVLDAAGIAVGLQPGSAPGPRVDAGAVPVLFDAVCDEPGAFAMKLEGGFGESTRILFDLFLREAAEAALSDVPGAAP